MKNPKQPQAVCHICGRKVLTFVRPGDNLPLRRLTLHDNKEKSRCFGSLMWAATAKVRA